MTPSELKYNVEMRGSYFFTRKTMKFFGDTMKNYGVRDGGEIEINWDEKGNYIEIPRKIEIWELYRKRPVKHGMWKTTYFDKKTFERVYIHNKED